MGSHYSCDPPEKRAKSAATLSFVPKGRIAAHGAASFPCAAQGSVSKGAILFHKREWPPFDPPRERTRGLPPRPHTLAAFILKSCTRCAIGCGVHGFAMNPCDSTHPATAPYYREARVTLARRQTACGMRHCFARRIEECHGRRKLSCTPTRWAERQRIIEESQIVLATLTAALPRAGSCIPKA